MQERMRLRDLTNTQRGMLGAVGGVAAAAISTMAFAKLYEVATRADSPNYVPARWRPTTMRPNAIDDEQWVRFAGRPDAGHLPRSWDTVGLLTASLAELDSLRQEAGTDCKRVLSAAAFAAYGRVVVGTLPQEHTFGRVEDDTDAALLAMRIGPGELQAVMGLLVPADNEFVVPATLAVYSRRTMPLADMAERFPAVPVV